VKKIVLALLFLFVLAACHYDKNIVGKAKKDSVQNSSDTIRIANDSLQYEVTIIDSGFNSWLYGNAKPRGYYSESYLENRNQIYVSEWNSRVMQPQRFDQNLYEMQINYDSNIHYGYEVNYLIYNYMIYFQIANKQKLGGFFPRP
jgi:hypothetical protein